MTVFKPFHYYLFKANVFNLGVNTGYDCLDYNEMNNGQKNNYKNLTISTMNLSEKIIEKVDYDSEK